MNKLYLHLYKNLGLLFLGSCGVGICKIGGIPNPAAYIIPAVVAVWGVIGALYNSALIEKLSKNEKLN